VQQIKASIFPVSLFASALLGMAVKGKAQEENAIFVTESV